MRRLFVMVPVLGLLAAACGGSRGASSGAPPGATTSVLAPALAAQVTPTSAPSAKLDPVSPGRFKYSSRDRVSASAPVDRRIVELARQLLALSGDADVAEVLDGVSLSGWTELEYAAPTGDRQRFFPVDDPSSSTEVEYRADGVYLVSTSGTGGTFTPAEPLRLLPLPAKALQTWSFELTSTDGCTVLNFDGRVDAVDVVVTIGARDTKTVRVHQAWAYRDSGKEGCAHVAQTSEYTVWYHPSYYLPIRWEIHFQSEVGVINLGGGGTSILRTGIPV